MRSEIEKVFKELGKAVQSNPFDFFKKNDVTCFLYQHFTKLYPARIKAKIGSGVERFHAFSDPEKMLCGRVHTEIKFPKSMKSIDMVILEDREYEIYSKSQNMVGGFQPPFLCAIEIKLAHGSKTRQFSKDAVPKDIVKLSEFSGQIQYPYTVLVDFIENRNESRIDILREYVAKSNGVKCVYASIDKFLIL